MQGYAKRSSAASALAQKTLVRAINLRAKDSMAEDSRIQGPSMYRACLGQMCRSRALHTMGATLVVLDPRALSNPT
eukprot:scaffold19157_cov22-Tisochrysis_lutea.AAC.1